MAAPRSIALAALLAAALAQPGCFDPDYPVGLPCGPDQFCPSGQTCNIDDICVATNPGGDGGNAGGDGGGDVDAGLGQLLSIDIGPDVSIRIDETYTYEVTAMWEGGSGVVDNALVIWSSTDNAIAFVDFMGVAHPQAEGTVTITADYNGRVDTAILTVTPAM